MSVPSYLLDLQSSDSGYDIIRLGTEYGGWFYVPSLIRQSDESSNLLLVGAGEDLSFDIDVLSKHSCARAFVFDPTPRALAYYNKVRSESETQGRDIWDRFTFFPYAVWDKTSTVHFYEPSNPAHVSHSITNLQGTDKSINVLAVDIASIPEICNCKDQPFSLFKMDIEGAETEVIFRLFSSGIPLPLQILVEFDDLRKYPNAKHYSRVVAACHKLLDSGYKLIKIDGLANFLFVYDDG